MTFRVSKNLIAILLASAALGIFIGLGFFTFGYGKGASYLGSDPNACANCHVMWSYRDSWIKSTHRHVAVCNDCHAPGNVAEKYASKAVNGFFHSLAFTTGDFPEPLRIKPMNRALVEDACRSCHESIATDTRHEALSVFAKDHKDSFTCTRCHRGVGHDSVGHVISFGGAQ